MTFSPEWNAVYSAGKQLTRWPWTDLVSAVKRHCANADGNLDGKAVLELGCGTGANMPFFFQGGAQYCGVDGSTASLEMIPPGGITLMHCDFTEHLPSGPFDLICDRAAVTHNDTESIVRCLGLAFDALKPGGYYIGIDWFSTLHDDARAGDRVDEYTRTNIPDGQFAGVGNVHFSNYSHLTALFHRFHIIDRAEKIVLRRDHKAFASWNIVARKS